MKAVKAGTPVSLVIPGLAKLLDMRLLAAGKKRVRGRMRWSRRIVQRDGIIHGGALAALADSTGGVGAMISAGPGRRVVTAEMKINYFGNIHSGFVDADARLLHRGRASSVWEIRLYSGGKGRRMLALAVVSYVTASGES